MKNYKTDSDGNLYPPTTSSRRSKDDDGICWTNYQGLKETHEIEATQFNSKTFDGEHTWYNIKTGMQGVAFEERKRNVDVEDNSIDEKNEENSEEKLEGEKVELFSVEDMYDVIEEDSDIDSDFNCCEDMFEEIESGMLDISEEEEDNYIEFENENFTEDNFDIEIDEDDEIMDIF